MLSVRATGFLLSELCERFGLCLPPEDRRRLLDHAPAGPEEFTAAVFAAEGVVRAPSHRALYRDALALVERAYANDRRPAT
jgi:hypothetical protein